MECRVPLVLELSSRVPRFKRIPMWTLEGMEVFSVRTVIPFESREVRREGA